MNFIKNPIKSNISFLELIKECEDNFYLKPSSPKTEIIKKKFLNFYRKKIKKNKFTFKYDKNEKIVFPYIQMGIPSSLGLFAYHEHNIFLYYLNNLKHYNKKVADIGANIGLHSIILSKIGYKVDAFEPDNNHIKLLKKNLKDNKCKNVKVFNKAIFDSNGSVEFIRVKGNTAANHISGYKENLHGDVERFKVGTLDIKKIVNKYDLIKLDAEGSEGKIIERLNKKELEKVDIICEISGMKNAHKIYNHCKKNKINIFSHKVKWLKVKKLNDLPVHHSEGLIMITNKKNFMIDKNYVN
jgi:FkbM family methyltransferase